MILCDIRVPEMPGPALARELLELRPDLAVLFISGYAKDLESWDGQLHDPLEKPAAGDRLSTGRGCIKKALSRRIVVLREKMDVEKTPLTGESRAKSPVPRS